ncbi:MAG: hypothetical protein ABR575_00950, partial [Actinomycetota bacterium]
MSRALARRAVAVASALSVALTVAVSPGSAAGAGARVGPNSRISSDDRPVRASDVPALAVDPANPKHVVEIEQEFRYESCRYHVTFDGGATWSGGDLRAPEEFPAPFCAEFDSGGYPHVNGTVEFGTGRTVYTAFSVRDEGGADSVLVARSTDGG